MTALSELGSRRAETAVAMTGGLGAVLYSTDQLRAFGEPPDYVAETPDTPTAPQVPQEQAVETDRPSLVSAAGEGSGGGDVLEPTSDTLTAQLPDIDDGPNVGNLIPDSPGPVAAPVTTSVSSSGSLLFDISPQPSLLDGPNVLNSLTSTLTIGGGGDAPVNLTGLLGGLNLDSLSLGDLGSLTAPVQAVLADTLHVVVDVVSGVTDVVGSLLSATSLTAPVGKLVEDLGDVVGNTLHGLLGLAGDDGGQDGLLDGLFSGLLGGTSGDNGTPSGSALNGLPLLGGLPGSGDASGPDSLVGDVLGLTLMGEGESPAAFDPAHDVLDVVGDLTGLLDLHSILDQPHGLPGGGGHIS